MVSAGIYQVSPEEHAANPRVNRDYDGMVVQRHATDVLYLILIWMMWIAMTYVGTTTQSDNSSSLALNAAPVNYQGNPCVGTDLYTVTTNGLGVCVPSCPSIDAPLDSTNSNDYVCFEEVFIYYTYDPSTFTTYIQNNCFSGGAFAINLPNCLCNIKRSTTDILRRCIFSDPSVRSQYYNQNAPPYLTTLIADVFTAKIIVLVFGFAVPTVLCFLYTTFLSIEGFGMLLSWGGLIGTCLAMGAFAYYAEETSVAWSKENPQVHNPGETQALKLFGYILAGLAGLFFCLVIFLRKQINLSVKVLALTSSCINDMKTTIVAPLVNVIAILFFLSFWFSYAVLVASDGKIIREQYGSVSGKLWYYNSNVIERLWFHFFCLLWTLSWIASMSAIAISIACAKWYFTEGPDRSQNNPCTVFLSYGITIRYHWGTAAFGSLVISVVEFVRWFLLYLQKQYNGMPCRGLVKFCCCCIQCCLCCLEKFLKFVSKNAFIQTAIHVRYQSYLCSFEANRALPSALPLSKPSTRSPVISFVSVPCMWSVDWPSSSVRHSSCQSQWQRPSFVCTIFIAVSYTELSVGILLFYLFR